MMTFWHISKRAKPEHGSPPHTLRPSLRFSAAIIAFALVSATGSRAAPDRGEAQQTKSTAAKESKAKKKSQKTETASKEDEQNAEMDSIDWAPYMEKVQKIIRDNWKPEKIKGIKEDKRTVLRFQITREGKPRHVGISETSGSTELDQEAKLSVFKCKFEPLPKGAPDAVDIEFTFDYNSNKKNKGTKGAKSDETATAADNIAETGKAEKASALLAEDNIFRILHKLMRVFAPILISFLLVVQTLMLIVFLSWLGIVHLKLRFASGSGSRSNGNTGKAPGEQTHEQDNRY